MSFCVYFIPLLLQMGCYQFIGLSGTWSIDFMQKNVFLCIFMHIFSKIHGTFVVRKPARQVITIQIERFHETTGLLGGKQILLGKEVDYRSFGEKRNLEGVHVLM